MSLKVISRGRALLYARVSHANERSVDSQLTAGRAWVQREGKTIVGEYSDDGISAFNPRKDRPDWKRVMAALAAGEADFLWCWEISRHSRDREVWAKLIRVCQAGDVMMVVGDRVHDPNNPDDGFMLDLSAALAIRESAMTRKRILRAVEDRALAGKPHGKVPYAYRREYDPSSGALLRQVPNEETAPIVAEMARRVLAGESMYAIAHDLTARAVPSPETVRQRRMRGPEVPLIAWYPGEIRDQIISPTNAGQRTRNGVVVADATWEAVISPADHAALVAKLAAPGRRTWKDGATKHLLTGIAECGVCGAPLRMVLNRTYPSYCCRGIDNRGQSCVVRQQRFVDEMVTETLIAFCEDPDVHQRLLDDDMDDGCASAAAQLADLRARLDGFVASAGTPGGISPEMLASVEARLRPLIADAQSRAIPRSLPPTVASLLGPQAREEWADLTVPQRRQVVRYLMRVVVHRSGRGSGARGFDPTRVQIIWLVGPGLDAAPGADEP